MINVVKKRDRNRNGGIGKMSEKKTYVTSKEEKQDLAVFVCVVIVWIGIEMAGVL